MINITHTSLALEYDRSRIASADSHRKGIFPLVVLTYTPSLESPKSDILSTRS